MTIDDQQGVPHVTRSLILSNVLDTDSENTCEQTDGLESVSSTKGSEQHVGGRKEPVESGGRIPSTATLKEIRAWLDLQCEDEQSRIDWSSAVKGARTSRPDEHGQPNKGLNTNVLNRINNGHGPRPSSFEDLLWPLRTNDDGTRFLHKPIQETPQEMEAVLQSWNRHVGAPNEDAETREALTAAMWARVEYLDGSLSYRRSADAHDITSRKLLHAIHAYRLETVHFTTTSTCELMTIILAHLGYAIPDIDQELKYLMFYTLVAEREYLAQTANAATARKLGKQIAEAQRMRDSETAERLEHQRTIWGSKIWLNNCTIIADRVRIARRNVESRALAELQDLTILQTAQKIALRQRISLGAPPSDKLIPRSIWLPEHFLACDSALTTLNEAADEHLSYFLASLKIVSKSIDGMHDVAHARILSRAMKFAGLDLPEDVSEAHRRGIVKARLEHVGTMNMISDAVEAITETKVKSREMVEVVGNMDDKFGDVLVAGELVGREFDDFVMLLEGDPAVDVWGEEWGKHG